MKKAFSWRLLILTIVFALASSLFLKVIEEREKQLDREFPRPCPYPARLFIEPDDGRAPIIEAIRAARGSIDLACYLFSDGQIIDELIKAQERGVRVRVILEREPYRGSPVNYKTRKKLEAAGIHFKWASSIFALMHAKVIIIDKTRALVMTLNLSRSAFTKNREYGVLIENPDIAGEIGRIFEADWKEKGYRSREPNLIISPENSRRKLTTLILRTKRRLWLQQLLLEDNEIMEALREAAGRGVEIKVLLADPMRVEGNLAARRYLEEFGIGVRFQYRPKLHAKFIDFDGECVFVGSQNLSSQSLDLNREIGILLVDKESILKLEETFLKDWERGK